MLVSAALGLSGGGTARAAQTVTVQAGDNYFYPYSTTINVGDMVVWNNVGSMMHTVVADPGQAVYWNSGDVLPGRSFSYTSSLAGNFTYGCFYHPEMTGLIVVQQPVPEFPGYLVFAVAGIAIATALLLERLYGARDGNSVRLH
jgi:plastocyanin